MRWALRHNEEEGDSGRGKEWCKLREFEENGFV